MAENTQNNVIQFHTSEKKAYERMPGEKALWFQRFKLYCQLGRERSLQRVWEQEQQAQTSTVQPGATTRKITATPGNWRKVSVQFQWLARAQEWDVAQRREWEDKLQKEVFVFCNFTSRAFRIETLDSYATFLQGIVLECFADKNVTMQDKLSAIKLTQSLMADIRRETDALIQVQSH